ncbi:MAG: DUF5916 domain-containing protein [Candidatus Neomarinimicrobiota bacterium]|nr:DUF5916 domain-containing protein [Candidatus Neomarinimicrobiota bacterium]
MTRLATLLITALICGGSYLQAQAKPTAEALLSKSTRAVRVDTPPVIDGRLDDPAWESALPVSNMIQVEPDNLTPPTELTEIRIVYDDNALYFAFRSYDSDPAGIMRRLARRDQWMEAGSNNADWVGVALDPQNDDRTGYVFIVNAAGVKIDLFIPDDENYDGSWDAVWDAEVSIDSEGWTVEIELPFSVFQFDSKGEQIWGLELNRAIYRKQEWQEWPGKPRGVKGIVSRYGRLTGLADIPPPKQLEVLPYALGGHRIGNKEGSSQSTGMDLEYGLSSNTSVSITLNPDFGQVEADPSVLNLTAFETFYPEKRPFFVEGGSFFTPQFGEQIQTWQKGSFMLSPIKLFHSRRIGRAPSHFSPANSSIISRPEATTILAAAKVLGKTPSGISYGFIESITNEEYGISEADDGTRNDFLLEPKTNYFIGRVESPVLNTASVMGATLTDMQSAGGEKASVGGVDWRLRFFNNRFDFSGQLAMSDARGQQGGAGRIYMMYDNFKWWNADLLATFYDDSFSNNDLGFLTRSGVRAVRAGGGIRRQDPWGPFRSNNLSVRYFHYARNDGVALSRSINWNIMNMFKSFWMIGAGGQITLSSTDDDDLFKNSNAWMVGKSPGWSAWLFFSTDPRKRLVLNPALAGGRSETGGNGVIPMLDITVNPTDYFSFSVKSQYWKDLEKEEYVGVIPREELMFSHLDSDFARVYSSFAQTMTDISLRASLTISPDLSFQLFAQPFRASGDYYDFKELLEEGTLDFDMLESIPYDPDFKITNTVGTFVMRWEYSLGSTLYAVYNLNDSNYYSAAADQWISNVSNSFFLKLNYWFQP